MENRELKIRKHAKNAFKEHIATVRVDCADMMVIEWRNKNGSSNYYMQFIIDKKRGFLSITGDLGDCNSCWYNPLEICNLVKYVQNIEYWMGKFQATSDKYTYEYSDIETDLKAIKKEYIKNKSDYIFEDKTDEEIEEDFEELASELEYNGYDRSGIYPQSAIDIIEKYNEEWWDGSTWTDLGKRIDSRVYIWSEGLKMAWEQIESGNTNTLVFNNKKFKTRELELNVYGVVTVAPESLEEKLFIDNEYVSNDAKEIDEQIFFYVPDEKINLPDEELIKFVESEVV